MQLFLHYILFGENFIGNFIFSMLESQSWKKQNSNQNVKFGKMVVLVKAFDLYHHKFQLFHLSCKIVKEFETEI